MDTPPSRGHIPTTSQHNPHSQIQQPIPNHYIRSNGHNLQAQLLPHTHTPFFLLCILPLSQSCFKNIPLLPHTNKEKSLGDQQSVFPDPSPTFPSTTLTSILPTSLASWPAPSPPSLRPFSNSRNPNHQASQDRTPPFLFHCSLHVHHPGPGPLNVGFFLTLQEGLCGPGATPTKPTCSGLQKCLCANSSSSLSAPK